MNRELNQNPWANRNQIIENIRANVDNEAIDLFSKNLASPPGKKRKLKGIYFDADIAEALDELKKKRVNISGFVNSVVRSALQQK